MENLTPGDFYRITGKERYNIYKGKGEASEFYPAMYVRDENIDCEVQHVFAALFSNGILMRVKVPHKKFALEGNHVKCETLETKIIVQPKSERAKSVNTFIEKAHRLVSEGPHAKLKLIIDMYKRNN